jgi:hypothetical protein
MPEDFTSPIGIRDASESQTWSIVVNDDGQFELRSNSPSGEGQVRLLADDETGRITIGTAEVPSSLTIVNHLDVEDAAGVIRAELDADTNQLQLRNASGETVGMIGAEGNVRAGTNGENGNLFLYAAGSGDILDDTQVTVRLNGSNGDLTLGGNGTAGNAVLRDAGGTTRARLSASGQRLEVLNDSGEIIGMLGGGGNLRGGSNGENGDLFLFAADATDIFDGSDATIRLNGSNGDMTLGGNDTSGNANLRDVNDNTRARLKAAGQRLEVLNRSGEIIGMLGGAGNVRAGSNGEDGDLFLYRANAGDIYNNADATVRLNGSNGDMTLGGNGTDGNANLRDANGNTRARMSAANQRMEALNPSGDIIGMLGGGGNIRAGSNGEDGSLFLYRRQAGNIFSNSEWAIRLVADDGRLEIRDRSGNLICMLGANGNLRMGGHGTDGDILLYPNGASDIFDNGAATIHMDANAGDITLRNADCAEEFEVADAMAALPGTVMSLGEGGVLVPSRGLQDRGVIGVVSGAGDYKPGIVLDRQAHAENRAPIALMGKTFVSVTDEAGAIGIGDLLTTASEPGKAMRVCDPAGAMGAVIGKAIGTLDEAEGMIPMVITLQ